jgi:hypothetical protein
MAVPRLQVLDSEHRKATNEAVFSGRRDAPDAKPRTRRVVGHVTPLSGPFLIFAPYSRPTPRLRRILSQPRRHTEHAAGSTRQRNQPLSGPAGAGVCMLPPASIPPSCMGSHPVQPSCRCRQAFYATSTFGNGVGHRAGEQRRTWKRASARRVGRNTVTYCGLLKPRELLVPITYPSRYRQPIEMPR